MNLNRKRAVSLLLSAALSLSLCACGGTAEETPAPTEDGTGIYTPGTYRGEGTGHGGAVVVETVFEADRIISVTVLEHKETAGIADTPIDKLPEQIVEQQSVKLDAISGASETSEAILAAVADCIRQAGGDPEAIGSTQDGEIAEAVEMKTQMVVVGSGFAGLDAALTAAEAGVDVILIEKLAIPGGSSKMASGTCPAPAPTEEEGILKTAEEHAQVWKSRIAPYGEEKLIDAVVQKAETVFSWLMEEGVPLRIGTTSFEDIKMTNYDAAGENDRGDDITTVLFDKLSEMENVTILMETRATKLIVENGAVIGVEAEGDKGQSIRLLAQATLLATGGYDQDPEMIAQYSPSAVDQTSLSSIGNTGDGLKMAMEIGADTVFHDGVIGTAIIGGKKARGASNLMINPQGQRFANENSYYPVGYLERQAEGSEYYWDIFDTKGYKDTYDSYIDQQNNFKADTLEELAGMIGVEESVLLATVARYNELCAKQEDEDFHKSASKLLSIEEGPFYALKITDGYFGSLGGIKINESCEVLDQSGQTIPGLYAAGEVANGDVTGKSVPFSGAPLTMAIVTGRIAGESIVAALQK